VSQFIHYFCTVYEIRVTKLSNDTKSIGILGVGGEQWTYEFGIAYIFICVMCTYSQNVYPLIEDKWYFSPSLFTVTT